MQNQCQYHKPDRDQFVHVKHKPKKKMKLAIYSSTIFTKNTFPYEKYYDDNTTFQPVQSSSLKRSKLLIYICAPLVEKFPNGLGVHIHLTSKGMLEI